MSEWCEEKHTTHIGLKEDVEGCWWVKGLSTGHPLTWGQDQKNALGE